MRTGNPCSSGSGSPFMPTARIASSPSSVSDSSGVLAVNPSTLRDSTMSAPACGPACRSTSRTGHAEPLRVAEQLAADLVRDARQGDRVLVEPHADEVVEGQLDPPSTMPSIVRRHVAGSTDGTVSAVSTR